jgi:hypothetical protein
VESVNITDNQTAVVRMASWAASKVLLDEGLEPNFQMTVRDRNRIGLQSDLLGATALGIKNVLCLSGDHQRFGDHPEGKNVFDLDSMQWLALCKKMRDEGKFLNDKELEGTPKIFIGAASNPFGDPFNFRPIRLAKKIAAGADFIQTQCIYNMDKWREFMKRVVDMGLHEKCYILAGITPHEVGGYGQVHGQVRARHGRARGDREAPNRRGQEKRSGRGHQDRHRADTGDEGDGRRGRCARHGHRVGAPRQGDHRRRGPSAPAQSRLIWGQWATGSKKLH